MKAVWSPFETLVLNKTSHSRDGFAFGVQPDVWYTFFLSLKANKLWTENSSMPTKCLMEIVKKEQSKLGRGHIFNYKKAG